MTAKEALHLWVDCLNEDDARALLSDLQDGQRKAREPLTGEQIAAIRESIDRTRTGPVLTTAEVRQRLGLPT